MRVSASMHGLTAAASAPRDGQRRVGVIVVVDAFSAASPALDQVLQQRLADRARGMLYLCLLSLAWVLIICFVCLVCGL